VARASDALHDMHIFYINLEAASDRRSFMDTQLADLGLAAERIPAVTPEYLTEDIIAAASSSGRLSVSPPELACTMSHRKAWQEITTRRLPMALILEDDVYLSRALPKLLELIEPACASLDIVRIETQNASMRLGRLDALVQGIELRSIHSVAWGCGGYIVTRSGAAKLLGPLSRYDIPVDHIIFDYHYPTARRLRTRQAIPAGVANGLAALHHGAPVFDSSLDPHRRDRHNRRVAERPQWRKVPEIESWETRLLNVRDRLRKSFDRKVRGIHEHRIPLM
jgi:glycosyl transferase, family 25